VVDLSEVGRVAGCGGGLIGGNGWGGSSPKVVGGPAIFVGSGLRRSRPRPTVQLEPSDACRRSPVRRLRWRPGEMWPRSNRTLRPTWPTIPPSQQRLHRAHADAVFVGELLPRRAELEVCGDRLTIVFGQTLEAGRGAIASVCAFATSCTHLSSESPSRQSSQVAGYGRVTSALLDCGLLAPDRPPGATGGSGAVSHSGWAQQVRTCAPAPGR
jgi:hypothetical protein